MILPYANKQLRNIDVWIGKNYDTTEPSLLILGQSDSGAPAPLSTYIPEWVAGRVTDKTFTDIYNACTDIHGVCPALKLTGFRGLSKQDFWDAIAFYNYIPGQFSPTDSGIEPTVTALESGIQPLHLLLGVLRPHGVFIVGLTHSYYSRPIVQAHGIPYVVIPHPRSGVSSPFITQSFDVLVRISTP